MSAHSAERMAAQRSLVPLTGWYLASLPADEAERRPAGYRPEMTEEISERDIVYQSALQLWAAAQTDFDPYQVPSSEWGDAVVPVRDVDIATDAKLDLETVRVQLRDLDGRRLVIGDDAGNLSVKSPIPEDRQL
jgi:hypothetical protein